VCYGLGFNIFVQLFKVFLYGLGFRVLVLGLRI
jgi:hypothetical protein